MSDGREPVTVFKCPCGRYIVTSSGLDDHLKTCRVLLDKVNTSGNNCEDDTLLINPSNSSKPDIVVGNVFGVEIIEFRPANVCLCRKESNPIDQQTLNLANSSPSVPKRGSGRPRKVSGISEGNLEAEHSDSDFEEYSDESLSDEEESNEEDDDDEFSLPRASKKRKLSNSNPKKSRSSYQRSTDNLAHDLYTFKCSVCPYTRFKDEYNFLLHMENVHGDESKTSKLVSCPLCGRMFIKKDSLRRHLRHHENAEGLEDAFNLWESWPKRKSGSATMSLFFSCKYCLISHSNHHSFISHMKAEHPDKGRFQKILCPYCKTHEFDKMKLFVVHMRNSHNEECYGLTAEEQRSTNERVPCPVCKNIYNRRYLREHQVVKHSVRIPIRPIPEADLEKFACPLCSTRIKSRIQLKTHFVVHLDNNPYVCKVSGCNYKGDHPCHLARHMRLHTGADLVQCPKCNVSFAKHGHITKHKCVFDRSQLIKDQNGFLRSKSAKSKCSAIGTQKDILTEEDIINMKESFKKDRININDIIKTDPVYLRVIEENPEFARIIFGTHSGNGPVPNPKQLPTAVSYRCDPCFTRFYDKKALATHKKICEVKPNMKTGPRGTEKLGCPICGSSYENFKALVDHVEETHPTKVFKCEDCERLYSAKHIIAKHSESHKKPFVCMSCLKRFLTQAEQIEHKKQCGGRKECSKCGKILVNMLSWQRHCKLIHGITVQYEDYPGYSKLASGPPKKRQKVTTKSAKTKNQAKLKPIPKEIEKKLPHKCKPCGTLFFDKNALATHQKICKGGQIEGKHGGERHGCPICGESFENFELLLQHVEGCHPLKVFKCDDCKRMFSEKRILYYHVRDQHVNKLKCSRCYRGFPTMTAKNDHQTKCRAGKKCSKCGVILVNRKTWRKHWRSVHKKNPPNEEFEDYDGDNDQESAVTTKPWTGKSEAVVKKEPEEPICYVEAGDAEIGLGIPVDSIVESEEVNTTVEADVKLKKEDEGEFILS